MRYGMPYRGSKNQIAKWVIENLPKKENLYDLFGGGGAITHCACESGKYTQIYYNDCNQLVVKAFDMAIHGKFRNENRWISHDEFMEKRRTDPYVAFCFSFGNNLRSYAYNKENEVIKQEIHKNYFENNIDIPKEIKLQSLQALNRLNDLEKINRDLIEIHNQDYKNFDIKDNSVIYCDPPYSCSENYIRAEKFDYEVFYSWCEQQKQITVISSYEMPEDRFICVAKKEKRSLMCKDDNTTKKTEKLFVPKHQYQMYLDAMAVLS